MKNSQTTYLILRLAAGVNPVPPRPVVVTAAEDASRAIGCEFYFRPIGGVQRRLPYGPSRIFFTLPEYTRDDVFAQRIGEDFIHFAEVLHGPLIDRDQDRIALPLLHRFVSRTKTLSIAKAVKAAEALDDNAHLYWHQREIEGFHGISEDSVAIAFRALAVLVSNDVIHHAVAFLADSQRLFHVWPGQLRDAILDGEQLAETVAARVQWESAFQSAYKAIEAVVGDPPKDEAKFDRRLVDAGIDPLEEVGYSGKSTIRAAIRELNIIRDRRAAHGSTPLRGISMGEMIECQACARHVVLTTTNAASGGTLF